MFGEAAFEKEDPGRQDDANYGAQEQAQQDLVLIQADEHVDHERDCKAEKEVMPQAP